MEMTPGRFADHIGDKGEEFLKEYEAILCEEANKSPLAYEIPSARRQYHTPFSDLLELVRDARNSALHEGSFARHLTIHVVELSLIIEDALMYNSVAVSDFMVRDPVCAYPWQPLSFIRQKMLLNSFSFLPVCVDYKDEKDWWVVSDLSLIHI